jgi:transposase-like protein
MIRKKKLVCPACGSENIAKIIFGFPGQELMQRALRREIVLGGHSLSDQEPQWHCRDCEDEW